MTWISINPNSEPKAAVNAAAYIMGVSSEEITASELAEAYNDIEGDTSTIILEPPKKGKIDDFIDSISSVFDEEIEEDYGH